MVLNSIIVEGLCLSVCVNYIILVEISKQKNKELKKTPKKNNNQNVISVIFWNKPR